MDEANITEHDEGKTVVNADGDKIGMVAEVRGDRAYVDPDPGIGDQIMSKLGWSHGGDEEYPLDSSRIAEVTDDQIRLQRDL